MNLWVFFFVYKMWKTITQSRNKKFIIAYYSLALIFVGVGLYLNDSRYYIIAVVFILLASFRKYWLMKKLKV